jgi:hypothetical protein
MCERPGEDDIKLDFVGGKSGCDNPTKAMLPTFDRGASNRYAARERDNGVARLVVRGDLALAWHGGRPMFLRWRKDWRRGAVLSTGQKMAPSPLAWAFARALTRG